MTSTYDAIVLGAGHNGLILQAYLGKAGMKTLAVERRAVAGGGLSTIEDPRHGGFFHNTHAFFLRAITAMPWYADLALERHGAQLIEPELNVALITGDGRALEWWTDIGKTIESFATFSVRDADTLRRWHDEFVPMVAQILAPEARSPPLPPDERRALLARTSAGRRLLAVSALCSRSTCAFKASAITSPRCWRARPKRRWRAAARRRSRARSKRRCARWAARSGSTPSPSASWSKAAARSASKRARAT